MSSQFPVFNSTTSCGVASFIPAALAGLAIYAEARRRRFQPTHSDDRIFRCRKCGYVCTDDPNVDRSGCSQCGRMNEAIEF